MAVISGRNAYYHGLKSGKKASALLRRNIHRLEKGLIMRPRRDSFAEGFINETVNYYQVYVNSDEVCEIEKKWFTDVLDEYFSIVKDTNAIAQARSAFKTCILDKMTSYENVKFTPYLYEKLPPSDIGFEELHQLFIRRRSVRWYENKPVPISLVEKAINIATLAPSACNRLPYSFYISSSKTKAVEMASLAGGTSGFNDNIPCTIAIVGDLSAYPEERDRHLIYIDASLAAMQLMLALNTLGLATCSINWPDIELAEKKMQRLLKLKSYQRPIMLLTVGYADEKGMIPFSQKKSSQIVLQKV